MDVIYSWNEPTARIIDATVGPLTGWTKISASTRPDSNGVLVRVINGAAVEIGGDPHKAAGSYGGWCLGTSQTKFIPIPRGNGDVWAYLTGIEKLVVIEAKAVNQ